MIKFIYEIYNCGQPAQYAVGGVKANNLIVIFMKNASNRKRNLKTSKVLLKSQAHQSTSLFTSTATNQRVLFQRVVKRSSGPISRRPEGDRVSVKVGVVQMERVND